MIFFFIKLHKNIVITLGNLLKMRQLHDTCKYHKYTCRVFLGGLRGAFPPTPHPPAELQQFFKSNFIFFNTKAKKEISIGNSVQLVKSNSSRLSSLNSHNNYF